MYQYRVSFWLSLTTPNPFVTPDFVTTVESDIDLREDSLSKKDEIISAGLSNFPGTKPKSYSALIFQLS